MGEPDSGLPRLRAGDVLAGRYLVADLLGESRGGRFWRAEDQVLARHVAVHVIPADDERAEGLLEAARLSANVHDRRVLRVLDADRVDGLCYVVNEWGAGSSLDIMIARDGTLPPRRAAHLVAEAAAVCAAAHEVGVAHGRLAPENLLVDHHGSVRVIGLAVEAALWGLPPGRTSSDVTDLGALLYAGLTGRWAGVSRSAVPPAHQVGGRVLRPRKVRAGVPRLLDDLCDEILNGVVIGTHARSPYDLATARGIADALADFVGDPTGLVVPEPERTMSIPVFVDPEAVESEEQPETEPDDGEQPRTEPSGTLVDEGALAGEVGQEPTRRADHGQEAEEPPAPEGVSDSTPEGASDATPEGGSDGPPEPLDRTEQPTQAGMPVFDDERDEVAWISARSEKPPPPPPFEEKPERPLFAPDPPEGRPVRTPRPGVAPTGSSDSYWPWEGGGRTSTGTHPGVSTTGSGIGIFDDDEDDDGVPGRNWLRLAALVAAGILLLVATVVAFNLGQGRSALEFEDAAEPETTPSSTQGAGTRPQVVEGTSATDLDPQGDTPEENPDLVANVVDGDPATTWRTSTYTQQFGPAGLKTGVGVVVDLGEVRDVRRVTVTLAGEPTGVRLYVTETAPTGVAGLVPVVDELVEGTELDAQVEASGQFVVVWLTQLPAVDDGFRGEVAEVVVRAAAS